MTHRLFLSEFICGGGWPDAHFPASLAAEGSAMLEAVILDFCAMSDHSIVTTWDHRLPLSDRLQGLLEDSAASHDVTAHRFPGTVGRLEVIRTRSPEQEREVFQQLAAECDATLVIAPEFDGILETRTLWVERVSGRLLSCNSASVRLCADKWQLAEHLVAQGIATIPTRLWSPRAAELGKQHKMEFEYPCVIKPRFGAGSQATYCLADASCSTKGMLDQIYAEPLLAAGVIQPFVRGVAVSVAVVCDTEHQIATAWPVARQMLSDDGRFSYVGGEVPFRHPASKAIQALARQAVLSVPGLRGYVGVDLLVCDNDYGDSQIIVVEINPRFCTSYLGYRQLAEPVLGSASSTLPPTASRPTNQESASEHLARWILNPHQTPIGLRWSSNSIQFRPDALQLKCDHSSS